MIYRIAIVESSEIVQTGIKSALDRCDELEIVALIDNAQRLDEKLAPLRADIIIINPTLVDHNIRAQIVSSMPSNTTVVAIVYTHIESSIYDQFAAIIDIFDPLSRIEEKVMGAIEARTTTDNTLSKDLKDQNDLTDREKDILVAAVKGQTSKEISQTHNISIHTVISHRKNITRKTGIKSLSGLTVYAILNNLINPNEIK